MTSLTATDRLEQARRQTLELVTSVSDANLERVHSPLMSPLVWDLGHIAAFEDLWLSHHGAGLPLLRADLANVYDAFETPRAHRGELPYLRRAAAEQYLCAVRERVRDLPWSQLHELVARHEHQHAETMLQTLCLARIDGYEPPARARHAPAPPAAAEPELITLAGGSFPLGAGGDRFAYDNERPQHSIEVAPFRIGRTPVTNRQWRQFISDDGYKRRELWSERGWEWRAAEDIERPLHWLTDDHAWQLGEGAVAIEPDDAVVHVSAFEADAFAHWCGLRLPSEPEWELAATWDAHAARKRAWPWGEEDPGDEHANLFEKRLFSPGPAAGFPDGAAPCGALGMIGSVWEWTSSAFTGYPGFTAEPYREYSEVFFGGPFRVLRGGSFATSRAVATPTFRNWDHPERRQIFAGVRLAGDL